MPRLNRNEDLRKLADVAREAIEGAAMANYRWREDEAYEKIDAALERLLIGDRNAHSIRGR